MILQTLVIILLLIAIILLHNKKESFIDVSPDKLLNCSGCLDENLRCRPGTIPTCTNVETNLCYAFFDENGVNRTPCGLYDRSPKARESCDNCQTMCQWCIDKYGKGTCISRSAFDCKLCPKSRLCQQNVFNIYIPKKG